ncbi:NEL-type E3 ubiquitin ligase domain-containing protein [Pseudomonas sp. FW305-3-2-15-C-LB1]|uniref:NEL-type E3 ubiquitin ligase domain-containing protein n=3 Tax=unclassified Pseudomonas TaxID=196821 RepID=UPI000C888374|nr:DUF6543 domain-containing protein [Pseudomonas sp. FW305-3-2-15-C-LB1]PMV55455.1 hypothetical protein C1X18_01890 [Pseudomonas sp. FW305-3-2-15-C-LB1]
MAALPPMDEIRPAVSESVHTTFLESAIPDWLKKATPQQLDALKTAPDALPDWYQHASAAQRQSLMDCITAGFTAQSTLDNAMSQLQDIDTFARPLLVKALKDQFKVELDVDKTYIRLRKSVTMGVFNVTAGWFEALKLPLLQAALHNFEAAECEAGAFHASSGFVVQAATGTGFDPVTTTLTVEQFTGLCRTLDIGTQYQAYLKAFLEPEDAVAQAVLRNKFTVAHTTALHVAAEQALMKKDISDAEYRMVLSVVAGEHEPLLNGKRVWFRDLSLMNHRLTGVVVFLFSTSQIRDESELLLYIPNDPQSPLKRYSLGELAPLFKQRFTTPDTPPAEREGPTAYQRFFSQFVNYADRADYFSQFTENAPETTFVQELAPFAPLLDQLRQATDPFYIFNKVNTLPPPPAPRQVPNQDPFLNPIVTPPVHTGLFWPDDFDLWNYLYEQHRAKLYADARAHAVPTADVDARVRSRKLAALLNIGMLLLTGVSMFVPGLGEVMMGVMASQLLYEAFEGVVEWEEGDRKAAKAHWLDVVQNVVLLAAMVGAGKGLAKLTAVPAEPVVEGLQPVTLPNGKTRLWKADLKPYETPVKLPPDARPDAHGLYTHEGQTYLTLEDRQYQVTKDPDTAAYRIQHPSRPEAYSPELTHNHEGAWLHEGENPQAWDDATALRRLGHTTEGLETEQLLKAQEASGVSANALREAHFNGEATPLLLADSLQRFKLNQDVSAFIQQLKSADPAVYSQADLGLQLDLMKRRGLLSSTPPLRVVDPQGKVLWEDIPHPSSPFRRAVYLTEQHLARGEGLREVLYTLQDTDPQLLDIPGQPQDTLDTRATGLRQALGEFVESIKPSYLEERYQTLTASNDPDIQRVQQAFPKLPTRIAGQLLKELSTEDVTTLRNTGRLPDTVAGLARWAEQETRVSRAYENLHLNTPSELDSQRLVLHTLETLPGWQRGTRVELRLHSPDGPLLDAIGEAGSTPGKTLVQLENGQFKGPDSTDMYQAILDTLSAGERQDLKLFDAHQLRDAIAAKPLPRDTLRTLLLEHPVRKPTYDATLRLLGGGRGYDMLRAQFNSPAQRVRRLYPSFSDAEVTAFIESLGSDTSRQLALREAEYSQLKADLKQWVKTNIPRVASSDYERTGGYSAVVAKDIKRCWRRETGTSLKIVSGMPLDLPALTADFSHVTELELLTRRWSSNAQTFLGNFTQLKKLRLENCDLKALPEGLEAMPRLTHLELNANNLVLTPQSAARLSALRQLETLDLSGNRLGTCPDFSFMYSLRRLNLSFTRLDQWPVGLRDKTSLTSLDLSHNQLREVPAVLLEPPPEQLEAIAKINSVTLLDDNPLPDAYRERFDAYWRRLSQQRPDLIRNTDAFDMRNPLLERARTLYPNRSRLENRRFIWGLGNGAEAELLRLEQEFQGLNRQLDTWASAGGNLNSRTGSGYVRTHQRLLNALAQDDRYLAKERIVQCWRKETPMQHAHDGTPIGLELDLSGLNLQSLPELDADFSHVGSLKLTNMQLSTSPEQFLLRHRGVRWLDLSQNQLRELPTALDEMNGLTRLFLHENQIQLTTQTAQVLAQRTTLRLLSLGNNPLRIAPDFSAITDLRVLVMQNCQLESFPGGLGAQPLLTKVELASNRITSLPDSLINPTDEQLAQSVRLTRVTGLSNNPLTEAVRQQVDVYQTRLELAGHSSLAQPNRMVTSIVEQRLPLMVQVPDLVQAKRWVRDLSQQELAKRHNQWWQLRELPHSDGFFAMLNGLEELPEGHADLQARVWAVIDAMTQNTAESEALRAQVFEWAGRPTCCDRAGLSFSNVEVMTMVHNAKLMAGDVNQGATLIKLSRGLFRLDEVEKAALNDIARRTQAINDNPALSAEEKTLQINRLEEVEIRLAYRFGLKDADQLDLPGQPQTARYTGGKVKPEVLQDTRDKILALNNSPAEFQALVARDFWQEYLTQKYQAQFEAQSQPFHQSLGALYDQRSEGRLTEKVYDQQAKDLQAQLAIQEANLIETLTRTELRANPIT